MFVRKHGAIQMSDSHEPYEESDLSPTMCFACRARFTAAELMRASIPPLVSLGAATDLELGDTEPPLLFVDRNWYCQRCRFQVNLRRGVLGITFLVFLLTAASVAAMLFRR